MPTVCGESKDFLKEPRLADFILPEVLQEWKKEAEQYGGLSTVPFVGNDYSDSWQTSFIVGPALIEGNTARVPVVYKDKNPQWTQSYTMICEMVDGRWWIKDQHDLITGID